MPQEGRRSAAPMTIKGILFSSYCFLAEDSLASPGYPEEAFERIQIS
jgi:hypothetical protein